MQGKACGLKYRITAQLKQAKVRAKKGPRWSPEGAGGLDKVARSHSRLITRLHQPCCLVEAGLVLEMRVKIFFSLFLPIFHYTRFFESSSGDTAGFFFFVSRFYYEYRKNDERYFRGVFWCRDIGQKTDFRGLTADFTKKSPFPWKNTAFRPSFFYYWVIWTHGADANISITKFIVLLEIRRASLNHVPCNK